IPPGRSGSSALGRRRHKLERERKYGDEPRDSLPGIFEFNGDLRKGSIYSRGESAGPGPVRILLFGAKMENNARCVGPGQLSRVCMAIETKKAMVVLPAMRARISCAWEPRKPGPRGFIGNSPSIPISGCLQ